MDRHWVYADDWLFALQHAMSSLPRLAVAFKVIGAATGLRLKVKK